MMYLAFVPSSCHSSSEPLPVVAGCCPLSVSLLSRLPLYFCVVACEYKFLLDMGATAALGLCWVRHRSCLRSMQQVLQTGNKVLLLWTQLLALWLHKCMQGNRGPCYYHRLS